MKQGHTILVTGGAGFIGSAVVRYLINEAGHTVVNVNGGLINEHKKIFTKKKKTLNKDKKDFVVEEKTRLVQKLYRSI